MLTYASVCDGIGAAHAAWMPLGWRCAWVSEIEPFPIAVVEHRVPGLPNLGDMTRITREMLDARDRPDVVVGGTPCQSFSVAGLRQGLDDPRGNLALRFMQLVGCVRPRWVVWENVPGVLSSGSGRDFGSILGALAELGYGWAYRVLDAQYFGVAQRRRRVFLVARRAGDWRRAAAVLFEREGMRGDPPTRRAARQGTAADAGRGAAGASWWDGGQLSQTLDAVLSKGQTMPEKNRFPAVLEPYVKAKRAQSASDDESWKPGEVSPTLNHFDVGDTRSTTVVAIQDGRPIAKQQNGIGVAKPGSPSYTIDKTGAQAIAYVAHTSDGIVADPITTAEGKTWTHEGNNFRLRNCVQQAVGTDIYNGVITGDVAATMGTPGSSVNASGPTVMEAIGFVPKAPPGSRSMGERVEQSPTVTTHQLGQGVATHMTVRRLTPLECERLQGFPDGWTRIPWRRKPAEECPDGPRYRAIGNSMAVPVMRWIGERIARVDSILGASE